MFCSFEAMKKCVSTYIFLILISFSWAQNSNDTSIIYTRKKIIVNSSIASAYAGSLIYLNQIWYAPYHTSRFHFFNDNNEWALMDKCGHFFTSFYASHFLSKMYQYAGYKKSYWITTAITWTYLLNIEIMDGFSDGWGFSFGDLTANTIGTSLFLLKEKYFNDFFILKISYLNTSYPAYNPTLLGKDNDERILKDYNGQTYWLSISPFYKWKRNLEWLCLSFGYGIDGFIGASSNIFFRNNQWYHYDYIKRQQQFYLSFDIDLSKIKTKKIWLQKILQSINWIKIPAPAIEMKGNNIYFRPLLFSN